MKKLLLLVIALLTISLAGCGGSASMIAFEKYAYIKSWAYREIPPSQVVTNGEVFYEGKLSDGKTFSIGEYIDDPDATYYYNALWQDLGWTLVSKASPGAGIITQTEVVVNTNNTAASGSIPFLLPSNTSKSSPKPKTQQTAMMFGSEETIKEGNQFTAHAAAHTPKVGHIYINIKRGIAVYFYSDKTFSSFRVKINTKEDN